MDRVGADFAMSVASIHKKLDANAWPVLLPLGREISSRASSMLLIRRRSLLGQRPVGSTYEVRIFPEHAAAVDKAYKELVEQISNLDDEVAEVVLEEKPVTPEILKAAIAGKRSQTICAGDWRLGIEEHRCAISR